jgi:hypothetical protein
MSSIGGDPEEFLSRDPEPVGAGAQATRPQPALSDHTVNHLMQIPGVDGVWVESTGDGSYVAVIYVTQPATLTRIPSQVEGLPVRTQLGEPIRALKR